MKTLCLLLITFVTSLLVGQDKNYQAVEGATHRISIKDVFMPESKSHCSGTAVAPHAILTAGHCEDNSDRIVVDGQTAYIMLSMNDGHDHSLLLLGDITFDTFVKIKQRPLVVSEEVFIVGNPRALRHQYRHGVIMGDGFIGDGDDDDDDVPPADSHPPATKKLHEYTLDLNGFFGDSGAGLFDSQGHLVGVVSTRKTVSYKEDAVYFMGALDLSFTPAQLDVAESFGTE